MKKQWKRLISLLLCAVLLTGIFPVSLHAAETSTTVKVSVNAKVCRQQTREVLRMVNEERAKKGRDPIIMSAEMEEAAIQRAFELVTYCSHARPNGNLYHTVFGEYGVDTNVGYGKWIGENIATGQNDAQQVMASWMDSSGHRDQILAKSFHYIGIGCVEYAGVKYWVQLFAQAPDNVTTAADAGADGIEMTKEYPVDVQYMIGKLNFETTRIEFPEPEVVFAKPGDTLEFDLKLSTPSLISKRNRVVGRINYSSLPPESITISEDAPLTVDEDGIHIDADAKMGTYTVTVTIGSTSAVKKINVTKSGEPCTHPEDRQVIDEKAPTCTEDGYRKVTCGDCEEVISDEVLEKVPHEKENDWYITEEATCTTEGLKVKRCIYCGLEMDTEIIPKSGEHKWDEGTLVKEATCTDTGSTTYTCTLCKTIRTETTEKLGHDELEAITEATCTTTGKKEVTCARCQEVLSSQVISALGHNWGEWQTVTEPTWDADGLEKRVCGRCGEEEKNTIPALSDGHEHDFSGEEVVEKQPTCTETGSKTVACTNPACNAIKEIKLPATGHNPGNWEVVEAETCAKEGKKVQKCMVCQIVVGEEIIPKIDEHTWNDGEITAEATCTIDGVMTYTCKVCGDTHMEVLEALGHQWSEWNVETEPTWDSEGLQNRVCDRCGEVEEQIIPKLSEAHEHDYAGEEIIIKEATCTEEGSKTVACSEPNCDAEITVVIPATGHIAGEWETVKEATAKEEGLVIQKCKICGEKLAEKLLPLKEESIEEGNSNGTNESTGTEGSLILDSAQSGTSEDSVKTGDNSNVFLWLVLAVSAAVLGAGTVFMNKKKKNF